MRVNIVWRKGGARISECTICLVVAFNLLEVATLLETVQPLECDGFHRRRLDTLSGEVLQLERVRIGVHELVNLVQAGLGFEKDEAVMVSAEGG